MNSIQNSVNETYKTPKAEVVTKTLSLFEVGKQKLIDIAKKTFPSLLSLGIGVATIPLNIIIHEYGHAFAGKFFDENCTPIMTWSPYLINSCVSLRGCNYSLWSNTWSNTAIDLAGPLAETIAILAVLAFSKSKYTPIALLPHTAHITYVSLMPMLPVYRGDYYSIYSAGPAPYSLAVAVSLMPLTLSILSLNRSFFSSNSKSTMKSEKNN